MHQSNPVNVHITVDQQTFSHRVEKELHTKSVSNAEKNLPFFWHKGLD